MATTETIKRNEELVLDDSVKLNKRGEAILGVLEGPCADVINPTRNERQYDEELWNNVFKDPIVNEYFECGGILGELDHPAERTETDTSKVAICMPEKPKKGKDGKLYAKFDILDTPNGRIVYTLAKYGYKLGVSSRGNGDVYEAYDGKEHVDPKSYELKAFDIVLLPAVKSARLALKESIGDKTFKQAIKESLANATKDEKAIMIESLENLKIDYKMSKGKTSEAFDNKKSNILTESKIQDPQIAANDAGAYAVKELQNQLIENKRITEELQQAQEKLSVCYAKEAKYEEKLDGYRTQAKKLAESTITVKALNTKIEFLTEQLKEANIKIENSKKRIFKLMESKKEASNTSNALNESLTTCNNEVKKLTESLKQEKLQVHKLSEKLEEEKKNNLIKTKEYSSKITKANKLVEHYKNLAQNALDNYIKSKAIMLGVTTNDIKSRLTESYSFEDIDYACEALQKYNLNMSKLPISLSSNASKVRVIESKETIKPQNLRGLFDDEVDDSLLRLAGLTD